MAALRATTARAAWAAVGKHRKAPSPAGRPPALVRGGLLLNQVEMQLLQATPGLPLPCSAGSGWSRRCR